MATSFSILHSYVSTAPKSTLSYSPSFPLSTSVHYYVPTPPSPLSPFPPFTPLLSSLLYPNNLSPSDMILNPPNHHLRPRRIRKPLMIRHDLLDVERILLHAHEIVDGAKHALHDTIVVRGAVELGAYELGHQEEGFGGLVRLWFKLIRLDANVLWLDEENK